MFTWKVANTVDTVKQKKKKYSKGHLVFEMVTVVNVCSLHKHLVSLTIKTKLASDEKFYLFVQEIVAV